MRFSPYRIRPNSGDRTLDGEDADYEYVSDSSLDGDDCLSVTSDDADAAQNGAKPSGNEVARHADGNTDGDGDADGVHLVDGEREQEDEDDGNGVLSFTDSEDDAYPVSSSPVRGSLIAQRAEYDRFTLQAIRDALVHKAARLRRNLASVAASAAPAGGRTKRTSLIDVIALDDLQSVDDVLAARAAQEREDLASATAYRTETQSLLDAIESSIATAEAKEAERRRHEAAERAERERRAAQEAAKKKRDEESRAEAARQAQQAEEEAAAAKKQADDAARQAEEQKRVAEQQATAEAERKARFGGASPAAEAQRQRQALEALKQTVLEPVSTSREMKNFCARARLKLNPKLGQLTNSVDQVARVFDDIVAILDAAAAADQQALCLRWCLNFTAKAMVRQAENEVMVNPTACYPLAMLAIGLMCKYDDFADVLYIRFAKKCPFVIPYVSGHDAGTEEGRKALGWKRKADGKYEDLTAYLERQCGIYRFYIAITAIDIASNPWPIQRSWVTVARLVSERLENDDLHNVALAIACTFLESAGRSFLAAFGESGRKLLMAMARWVGPDEKGPNANRLRILLETWQKDGSVGLDFSFER